MSLVLHKLGKAYGSTVAVAPTDLEVAAGQAWGLLGPNGSGKSTLLALVCGLRVPTSGTAQIEGLGVRDPRARQHLAALPQEARLPGHHTLRSFLRGLGRPTDETPQRLGLASRLDVPFERLSRGQRQRAALCVALAGEPRWLILDEPLTALDAPGIDAAVQLVSERVSAGAGALIATHRPAEWAGVLTHRAELERGVLRIEVPA